jgi:hypothetical protein
MSCCGGTNFFGTLPVPASNGDGPIVDLSALARARTFLVDGSYSGRYTIMGSQDGTNFVPILNFAAGAGSQRRQVSRANVRFVRVRRVASGDPAVITFGAQFTCPCPGEIIL